MVLRWCSIRCATGSGVHGGRRLPLRPGGDAWPHRPAALTAMRGFSRRSARTRCWPRQADRRALGYRARRLSAGRFSAALHGMERPVSRRCAQVLARRCGPGARTGRAGSPARRCCSTIRGGSPPARSTSSPPMTVSRWPTVSYAAKHNEANGEDNRDGHDANHSDNLGVEGRPRTPRSAPPAAGAGATCWRPCSCRRARRCCWPATSSATARAATTTPIARTTRPAGSTGPPATPVSSPSRGR
jgi:hypothetical protein